MLRSPLVLLALSLPSAAGGTPTRPAAQPAAPADRPHFDLPDVERRVLRERSEVRGRHGGVGIAVGGEDDVFVTLNLSAR